MRRIVLPCLLLFEALVLRTVGLKKFDALYDEQITRAVADNIWKGDLRNNWKYAEVPVPYRIDCYNFSSYMYFDALFAWPHRAHPLHRERLFSAVCGVIAIYFFYLVALDLFGTATALVSLAVMAVIPLLVQDSHYARPEAFVTLLCALEYLFCIKLLNSPRHLSYLSTGGFCCGLLIASKISMIPMALIPLICLAASHGLTLRRAVVWLGATTSGTFAGVPDAFFHPQAFWNGVRMLRDHYANQHPPHSLIDASHSFRLAVPYFYQTIGPAFCVLCIAGIVVIALNRKHLQFAIVVLPVLFYFTFLSLQRTFFERNLSHVVPLMAILSGVGCVAIARLFPGRAGTALAAVVAILMLIQPTLVSRKLAFVAMRTTYQQRFKDYQERLARREQLAVQPLTILMARYQVDQLVDLANRSERDVLVPVFDFHDGYTRRALSDLKSRINTKEVGYVPSLFPESWINTIITYHAPAFRYIRLSRR